MRSIGMLVVAVALSLGCGKKQDGDSSDKKQDAPAKSEPAKAKAKEAADLPVPDTAKYQVRGRFMGVDGKTVKIHHEAIPDFHDRAGNKVGMMSMAMRFRVGDDVAVNDLADNDVIEFEFVVEWDQKPPIKVVSIKKLPADTELEL